MRSMEVTVERRHAAVFRGKVQTQTLGQFGNLYDYLGNVVVAPVFFVALLHLFKRRETASLPLVHRWPCGCARVFGMSVFGMSEDERLARERSARALHSADDLLRAGARARHVDAARDQHPLRAFGFLSRALHHLGAAVRQQFLELVGPPGHARRVAALLSRRASPCSVAGREPKEIIASDMPWAVAWYADRKSLWLPISVKDFLELNDYSQLNGQIVGLYLTPVTGNQPFLAEIVKGEYKEWAPFIIAQPIAARLPAQGRHRRCRSTASASSTATATAGRIAKTERCGTIARVVVVSRARRR